MKAQENLSKNEKNVEQQPYNFNYPRYEVDFFPLRPLVGESNFPASETIPDQSLSIQEILDRHTRGLRTPDSMAGYYDEGVDPLELDGVDFNSLDLSEKMDVIRNHKAKAAKMRKQYESNETSRKQAELTSKVISDYNKQQEALKAENTKNISTTS